MRRRPRRRCPMSDMESDRLPQHEPPPASRLIQPEVDARDDSLVVEGDDRDHVLPPTELDPFTPDPAAPTAKARTAMWLALAVVPVVVIVILIAPLRRPPRRPASGHLGPR